MGELKQKAIQDLKKIRDTGKFNLFMQRREVMQYANNKNYFNLVSYVGNDVKGKYQELLNEDWENLEIE